MKLFVEESDNQCIFIVKSMIPRFSKLQARFPRSRGFADQLSRNGKSNAFSLVEVTLSIGIVAFGLIAILGLLPSGLQSFRGSIGRTVGAQVAQGIISGAKQADFTSLTNGITYSNYTQEGIPAKSAADTIFTAEITVTNQSSVPGTGTTRFINRSLALVKVRVVENPARAKLDAAAFTGSNIPTFSSYVAKAQ